MIFSKGLWQQIVLGNKTETRRIVGSSEELRFDLLPGVEQPVAYVYDVQRERVKWMVGRTYVEIVRNLPPLVLVFIFYFFVADQIMPLLGLEPFVRSRSPQVQAVLGALFAPVSRFTQFLSAVVTIAAFEGAYITEIIRAGIESVERGQREAAYALGLSWLDQMRLVILPQALKRILPALAGQFISTIKDSAIVAAISIQELTYQGMQLAVSTHFTFEVWLMVAVLYLVLTLTLSLGVSRLEKSLRKSD